MSVEENKSQKEQELQKRLSKIDGGVSPYYKEMYGALLIESEAKRTLSAKEMELKEVIALFFSAYKKDGKTLDTATVNAAALKGAMEVDAGMVNKLELQLELQDEYLSMIKSGDIPRSSVDAISREKEALKGVKGEVKDVKEGLKTKLDTDVVEAIFVIAQGEIKSHEDAIKAEEGKKVAKPKETPLDGEDGWSLLQFLKTYLGK